MLLTQIKKDRMLANKDGNKKKYETLTTLLSEIQRLEKADQEDDSKVQAVCKKYVKGLEEMVCAHMMEGIDNASTKNVTGVVSQITDKLSLLKEEKEIVEEYLPKQLGDDQLEEEIRIIIEVNGYDSMKDMGKIMKELKEKYDGQYDGKLASQIVKDKLSK